MVGSALLLLLAQVAAPEALKPDGPWQMDEKSGCTLSRQFTSAAGPVTLGIAPNIGAAGGELVMVLPGRATGRYGVDEGRIVVGENAASFPTVWSRVGRRDKAFNGVTIQPADAFWSTLPTARLLTIDVGKREQVRLELGPMGAAAAALDKCRGEKAAQIAAARRR